MEEVQDSLEGAFGAESAFGDGFEASEFGGEPGDDEAGFGEPGFAQEDGLGEVHEGILGGWEDEEAGFFTTRGPVPALTGLRGIPNLKV